MHTYTQKCTVHAVHDGSKYGHAHMCSCNKHFLKWPLIIVSILWGDNCKLRNHMHVLENK